MNVRRFFRNGGPPVMMGVLNVTPDSFSDGGRWNDPERAVAHAVELVECGADIIDIGGESTRPGAEPVSEGAELSRVLPAVKAVRAVTDVPISVDTMKATVAREAIGAGADIINDVSGFADRSMVTVVADTGTPIIVMSCYGDPSTFRTECIPGDAVVYARSTLERLIHEAEAAGVRRDRIIVDPGVGFGTTSQQSMALLRSAREFSFGGAFPVLIGPSRKRFLADFFPGMDRDEATAEACRIAAEGGADILRVHDISSTCQRRRRHPPYSLPPRGASASHRETPR